MKNKKRVIFVLCLLAVFAIYLYITLRGEYLQILGIGEEYVKIFTENLKQKSMVFVASFVFAYVATYITTLFIKKGLKVFFKEDNKEFPKLPNKSISLCFGIVAGLFFTYTITQKAILAFNSTWFVKNNDPIFNLDIGYYMFQKPFIEAMIAYLIGFVAILTLYIAAYYIIAFNKYFDEGISMETLKKNAFIKQLIVNICIIVVLFSAFTFVKVQDVLFSKYIVVGNDTELYGAGLVDVFIKVWGYRIFAVLILVCLIIAIINFKKQKYKKLAITIGIIPAYLILLFIAMAGTDLIYVKPNELDRQKTYIDYSIKATKNAYNINTDEVEIESSGTITSEDISANENTINNINILNDNIVLSNLQEYQTSLGYYTFKNTKIGLYNINGEEKLVYVSPREILSNDRTYNSKTYEYTHGYGAIVTSATTTDSAGYLDYIKNGFVETDEGIVVTEPRIYFGTQTNTSIVTNNDKEVEYDYPLTSTTNNYNTYTGKAGLNLNFLDRLILGIKEKNLRLAFSDDTNNNSSIITSRMITKRAQKVMPYLVYDNNPYLVITDEGELVWVIDAYTVSSQYPYSQIIEIETDDGEVQKINYIRNSVKVLINAYDGTMKFYITDRTDPIIMAYYNMYTELFQDKDEKLPETIADHIVYAKYLYDVQAKVLETYHDVQAEVLYRADDIWSIATENTNKLTSLNGTTINSYYTMLKTIDSNNSKLGLVVPYTIKGKQNISSYLVGTYDAKKQETKLTIYKFKPNNTILGTIQLDALIEQDETISNEIEALNVPGAKIVKNIIVVPINNTLLYVEPIYQIMLNEKNEVQVPVLKEIVVASGNKIAIGHSLNEALKNLVSQEAVSIDVTENDTDALILEIIKANKNLEESNASNDWEMIGKDMSKLQLLIKQLEETYSKPEEPKVEENVSAN